MSKISQEPYYDLLLNIKNQREVFDNLMAMASATGSIEELPILAYLRTNIRYLELDYLEKVQKFNE